MLDHISTYLKEDITIYVLFDNDNGGCMVIEGSNVYTTPEWDITPDIEYLNDPKCELTYMDKHNVSGLLEDFSEELNKEAILKIVRYAIDNKIEV